MRAISCCLIACIFVLVLSLSVNGITLDGDIGAREWNEATIHELIKDGSESNCNVDFAALYYLADRANHSIFLGLKYTSADFDLQSINTAVEISINGIYGATLYAGGDEMSIDRDKIEAEFIFAFNERPKETYCEMRIGVKYWIEEKTVIGIRVFDYNGIPSNYYEVIVSDIEDTASNIQDDTKSEPEAQAPHGSLSEHKSTTVKRQATLAITANSATATQTEHKTDRSSQTEPFEVTEKVSLTKKNEKTTKEEVPRTEEDVLTADETTETQVEFQGETVLSKAIDEVGVKKQTSRKAVGYSIATAMLVSAVFIGVIVTVMKPLKK